MKVSIIVPVYNTEKYLDRCIKSLLNQSYKNIEIILVNDGSIDNSLKIIKKYEKEHSNIIVLNQRNHGAGSARNNGLKHSKGDYVTFLDSDDSLAVDAIKNMVSMIDKDTEVVIGGIRIFSSESAVIKRLIPKDELWSELKYTATAFKLYSAKLLKNNNITFNNYYCNEDLMFCLSAYSKAKNIKVCSTDDYYNYKNKSSVTSKMKNSNTIFNVSSVLNDIYENISLDKYDKKMIQFFFIKTIVQNILMQLNNGTIKEINNIFEINYNWLVSKKKYGNHIRIYFQKSETLSINLIVNLFIISKKLHFSKILICLLKKLKIGGNV